MQAILGNCTSTQKNNKKQTRKRMDTAAIVYNALPDGYAAWQAQIVSRIQQAKYQAMIGVNAELLSLYWHIGQDILQRQKDAGGVHKLYCNCQKTYRSTSQKIEASLLEIYGI